MISAWIQKLLPLTFKSKLAPIGQVNSIKFHQVVPDRLHIEEWDTTSQTK